MPGYCRKIFSAVLYAQLLTRVLFIFIETRQQLSSCVTRANMQVVEVKRAQWLVGTYLTVSSFLPTVVNAALVFSPADFRAKFAFIILSTQEQQTRSAKFP